LIAILVVYTDAKPSLSGTDRGRKMLHRLWDAARARADELRVAEGTDGDRAWSTGDMMAKLIDYTRDQMERPPLDRVEHNFLLILDYVHDLARRIEDMDNVKCMRNISLVPIQTERYTRIKTKPQSN